jgi:hypothetical protein
LYRALFFSPPLKRQASNDRIVAEARAHAVDGVFRKRRAAVDEIGGVGPVGAVDRA